MTDTKMLKTYELWKMKNYKEKKHVSGKTNKRILLHGHVRQAVKVKVTKQDSDKDCINFQKYKRKNQNKDSTYFFIPLHRYTT